MKLDFLAIGNLTHDLRGNSTVVGGACIYSALTARRMGAKSGIVSKVGRDFSHFSSLSELRYAIEVGDRTTTFQNIYSGNGRIQKLIANAGRIDEVPDWDAKIVYICPVFNEVDAGLLERFSGCLVGLSPQGLMRKCLNGRIVPSKLRIESNPDVVVMSEEDLGGGRPKEYISQFELLIITRAKKGCTLYVDGKPHEFPAYVRREIDPTGAGDVFGAAFMLEYYKTGDPYWATVFATCAASFVVEKVGISGVPRSMDDVMDRVQKYEKIYQMRWKI